MGPREPEKNVDYVLGRIESTLDVIKQTLSEDRLASAQYRTEVRKELRESNERITALEGAVKHHGEDLAEVKQTVNELQARALMSKGAMGLAIVLGKGAHILSAAIGGIVVFFLEHWFRSPR